MLSFSRKLLNLMTKTVIRGRWVKGCSDNYIVYYKELAHSKRQFPDLSRICWKIPLCQSLSAKDAQVAKYLLGSPRAWSLLCEISASAYNCRLEGRDCKHQIYVQHLEKKLLDSVRLTRHPYLWSFLFQCGQKNLRCSCVSSSGHPNCILYPSFPLRVWEE